MIQKELERVERALQQFAESQGLRIRKDGGGYDLYDPETGNSQAPSSTMLLEELNAALHRRPGLDAPHDDPLHRF